MKSLPMPLPSSNEDMPNRSNILQEVFKELREIVRAGPLETDLKGFCFEFRHSLQVPVRIRWRIYHSDNTKE